MARIWKTTLFLGDRLAFRALLKSELEAFQAACEKASLKPAVRLDGGSDTGEAAVWFRNYPKIQFFDYTKSYLRALVHSAWRASRTDGVEGKDSNWTVCFSFDGTETGHRNAKRILKAGGTVSVVFNVRPETRHRTADLLPDSWNGFPVFDGDEHDFLPADPIGAVRGLRFKALRDRAGMLKAAGSFVQEVQS